MAVLSVYFIFAGSNLAKRLNFDLMKRVFIKGPVAGGYFNLAILSLCLWASTTKADTVSSSFSVPSSTTEWNTNFVLQEFNPAQGSLQSVYIAATESVNINGIVTNTSALTESFTFKAGSQLVLTLPGTLGTLLPSPLASAQAYNLPSGGSAAYGPVNASDTANGTYTLPADLNLFIGTGTLILPGYTQTSEQIIGGGANIGVSLFTVAGATVQVVYTYAPVPEPTTLSLFALGGALWLLRPRR